VIDGAIAATPTFSHTAKTHHFGMTLMFQHILVPTDGSLLSASVVDRVLDLAREAGAKVTVVTVVEPVDFLAASPADFADTQETMRQYGKAQAARFLSDAERKAKALGVQCTVVQVESAHPFRAIIDTAKKSGCDLIAMASHGRRGVSALVIGSETNKVLTHSSIPVLVYR